MHTAFSTATFLGSHSLPSNVDTSVTARYASCRRQHLVGCIIFTLLAQLQRSCILPTPRPPRPASRPLSLGEQQAEAEAAHTDDEEDDVVAAGAEEPGGSAGQQHGPSPQRQQQQQQHQGRPSGARTNAVATTLSEGVRNSAQAAGPSAGQFTAATAAVAAARTAAAVGPGSAQEGGGVGGAAGAGGAGRGGAAPAGMPSVLPEDGGLDEMDVDLHDRPADGPMSHLAAQSAEGLGGTYASLGGTPFDEVCGCAWGGGGSGEAGAEVPEGGNWVVADEMRHLQSYLGPLDHLIGAVVHLVTVDYYKKKTGWQRSVWLLLQFAAVTGLKG
jgi:hypothetical protein